MFLNVCWSSLNSSKLQMTRGTHTYSPPSELAVVEPLNLFLRIASDNPTRYRRTIRSLTDQGSRWVFKYLMQHGSDRPTLYTEWHQIIRSSGLFCFCASHADVIAPVRLSDVASDDPVLKRAPWSSQHALWSITRGLLRQGFDTRRIIRLVWSDSPTL